MTRPLDGLRVLDRTTDIAGPYCTKLLADAGADVVKVEPPDGDPLRRWRSGGLFEHLNASKRSVVGDDVALLAQADVLVANEPVDADAVHAVNPAVVIVTITPFGTDGPWADRPATEFTLQAACGSTGSRGLPGEPPISVGGRLGEWITGTYAAVGALAAGPGEVVDVAMLDCMAVTLCTYPSVFSSFMGWPPIRGTGRTIEVPSIEPTADDYVVLTTNSAQQFEDLMSLIGRSDLLAEDPQLTNALYRFRKRAGFMEAVRAWTTERTAAQVLEEAGLLRIPSAPVLHGGTVPAFEQFEARGVYERSPSGRFRRPRVPYRLEGVTLDVAAAAPELGADTGTVEWAPRPAASVDAGSTKRPLEGVRVVDCTAWWAGPSMPHVLAALGADVVKVESATRPDPMRFSATRPPSEAQWFEWGPLFHAVNNGKRGVTIDLTTPDGVSIFEDLVRTADVVVENFTPRVMEQFGLGWDRVHEVNPDVLMVRMPAFGLDGPWRDRTGFAQTMECIAGMAWMTGPPDGPPVLVRGACDPLAGMHAAFATLVALRHVASTDDGARGRLLETAMVESALNVAAELVIEHDVSGTLLTREGNRGPVAAPQGVYRCAGEDGWAAIAVATDEQWTALREVLGSAEDPALAGADGRRAAHDAIDEQVAAWCADRDVDEVVEQLVAAGVPAAVVISARDAVHNPQLRHRGLFEVEDHPVSGQHEMPVVPFRYRSVERWMRRPAPTLGQHNDEVLGEVVSAERLAQLRESGIIGEDLRS
jgi:crotonobetainyl-CoA:carnitine CoA-transferase CaiB-like acyl-CoA transferase